MLARRARKYVGRSSDSGRIGFVTLHKWSFQPLRPSIPRLNVVSILSATVAQHQNNIHSPFPICRLTCDCCSFMSFFHMLQKSMWSGYICYGTDTYTISRWAHKCNQSDWGSRCASSARIFFLWGGGMASFRGGNSKRGEPWWCELWCVVWR